MYQDLREKAEATGRWRVHHHTDGDGKRWFRDNQPGDPLPQPGSDHGLPGHE